MQWLSKIYSSSRLTKVLALACAVLPLPISDTSAQTSELNFVQISSSGALKWYGITDLAAPPIEIATNGTVGDNLAPGSWFTSNISDFGVIRLTESGSAKWIIESKTTRQKLSFELGNRTATVVAGADVDGNGLLDAITVSQNSRRLQWSIIRNPALDSTAMPRTLSFGDKRDRPFFFSPDGKRDALALLTKESIRYRYLDSRRVYRLPLRKGVRGIEEAPTPVRTSQGADALVFRQPQDAGLLLTVASLRRGTWRKVPVSARGIMVVGEFMPERGEEVGIRNTDAGPVTLVNPFTQVVSSVSAPQGILFDTVNINKVTAPPSQPSPPNKRPAPWPACPNFDSIRGGFIVLPGSNYPSVKVILPTSFTALDPGKNVSVQLVGPTKSVAVPFETMANPDPEILRAHYTIREDCREVIAELGTPRPLVVISGSGVCQQELQAGKTLCDRSD